MRRQPVRFSGQFGELAGSLELPAVEPAGFALFAHCFTCGKDSLAASRIGRHLAAEGVAVLRFDFTGLGGSDGDFANSDFSANVDDLVAAADFLRNEYSAPTLLIGHSLGGTAVIAAAERIAEAKAVVTIGAPAAPEHVLGQLGADVERIEREGVGDVRLGEQSFRITRSFIDDLRDGEMQERIRRLRRALLVMHSPADAVVGIDEASEIFTTALHPKSFVSLDGADHLLLDDADAEFAASVIAGWALRYIGAAEPAGEDGVAAGRVRVDEANRRFLRRVQSDDHRWLSDEPERAGGDNLGPDPYEHLLAALGTCTSMTIRMYANRKEWPLDDVRVELEHTRDHGADCEDCEAPERFIDVIGRSVRVDGDLSDEQRARLLEIADRCPVHKTLSGRLKIETRGAD